jgi:hypothetical protein
VRCVIAAGWKVLDDAAQLFAETFYEHFLDGTNFGDSVLAARGATFDAYGSSNTWGAYQCYGDPGFVLPRRSAASNRRPRPPRYDHYLSASEVLCELERLTLRASHALDLDKDAAAYAERHAKALLALCERQGWIRQGNVLEAFGALKAEYNRHEDAIDFYRRALAATDASTSRKAEEQLANMLTRRADRRRGGQHRRCAGPPRRRRPSSRWTAAIDQPAQSASTCRAPWTTAHGLPPAGRRSGRRPEGPRQHAGCLRTSHPPGARKAATSAIRRSTRPTPAPCSGWQPAFPDGEPATTRPCSSRCANNPRHPPGTSGRELARPTCCWPTD